MNKMRKTFYLMIYPHNQFETTAAAIQTPTKFYSNSLTEKYKIYNSLSSLFPFQFN